MTLTELGWPPARHAQGSTLPLSDKRHLARVLGSNRNIAWVQTETQSYSAHIAPSGSQLNTYPVVGDWCEVSTVGSDQNAARVTAVLPRQNQVRRKQAGREVTAQTLAANVDQALILTARNEEFSWNRLDRYLAMVLSEGIRPLICLTKAELDDDRNETAKVVQAHFAEVPTLSVSAVTGLGLAELQSQIPPHSTTILLGSSGVGKSTLTNRLLNHQSRATNPIRENDSKGRHTTSNSHMFRIPNTGWLIDAPGLREIEPWDAETGIETHFADIELLAQQCRFRDCAHTVERDCAVVAAIDQGLLAPRHLDSYHRLKREQQYQEERTDRYAQANKKRKIKSIMKEARKVFRHKQQLE